MMNVAVAIYREKNAHTLLNKEILAASQGIEHFVCSFYRN